MDANSDIAQETHKLLLLLPTLYNFQPYETTSHHLLHLSHPALNLLLLHLPRLLRMIYLLNNQLLLILFLRTMLFLLSHHLQILFLRTMFFLPSRHLQILPVAVPVAQEYETNISGLMISLKLDIATRKDVITLQTAPLFRVLIRMMLLNILNLPITKLS